jgi:cbb3-type cytochrome oxidase subunit 3
MEVGLVFGLYEIVFMLFIAICAYVSFRRGQKSIDLEAVTMFILKQLEDDGIINIDPISGDITPVQRK